MNKDNAFEWLENEISEVKTKNFFQVDGPASADLEQAISSSGISVPNSYKAFVLNFGNAKLYKQVGGYALGVRACPKEAISNDGESLLCFGHYLFSKAFFKTKLLDSGKESPVFESQAGGLRKTANGFAEWLQMRSSTIRKGIGKNRWSQIVNGPKPFTKNELNILEARRSFDWRIVSIDEDGNVNFEVFNDSTTVLPFLSVGIRSKDGGFSGAVYLPVSDLAPGSKKTVKHECYKGYIDRNKVEAYELQDPGPEDRDEYWEFK